MCIFLNRKVEVSDSQPVVLFSLCHLSFLQVWTANLRIFLIVPTVAPETSLYPFFSKFTGDMLWVESGKNKQVTEKFSVTSRTAQVLGLVQGKRGGNMSGQRLLLSCNDFGALSSDIYGKKIDVSQGDKFCLMVW